MRSSKVGLAIVTAAALLVGAGTGWAQSTTTTTTTTITPEQETTIYRTVTHDQVAVQPSVTWSPSVGVVVPDQVQLYNMPTTVDVPSVQTDRYTVIDGHVVLVDPSSRKVVRIIEH